MPSPGDQWCSAGHKIPTAPPNVVLSIADLLLSLADAPLAVLNLVAGLQLIPLITDEYCSVGAVYPGDPTSDDFTAILNPATAGAVIDKYIGLAKYYAWPQYCVCDTFVSPYTAQPAPPAWPTGTYTPTNLCSPVDLSQQLNGLLQQLANLWTLVSLIAMRTGAMSYVLGDAHTVSDEGELSVSGILGVLVDGLTFAPGTGFDEADPARIYDIGWIALGNSDGWQARQPIWHAPQFFLGATPGISRIGFTCGMATSVRITELLPSPSSA